MKINRRNFLGMVGTGATVLGVGPLVANNLVSLAGEGMHVQSVQKKGDTVILLAHPDFAKSKANKALTNAVKDNADVRVVELYTAPFTLEHYKPIISAAKTIVFQFPFYWASAPSMLKKWCDEILMGLTNEVKGKKLLVATTTGSEQDAYRSGGRNQYTLDELLRPYQLLANHSGMIWQTPFVVYGASLPDADKRIKAGAASYKEIIHAL